MGILTTPLLKQYSDLNDIPTTIIAADPGTLVTSTTVQVCGIVICNKGEQNIRINLRSERIDTFGDESNYLLTDFLVKSADQAKDNERNSVDLIKVLDTQITLIYQFGLDYISDSLVCFSNGYTQEYDCTVYYYTLNEL